MMTDNRSADAAGHSTESVSADPVSSGASASESVPADSPAPEENTGTEHSADAGTPPPTTEEDWLNALRQVVDPELMVNIVDLGLVYSVAPDEEEDHALAVEMTLTSPACPAGPQIIQQAKMALERLRDVNVAKITLTMTPPWTPERMTDEARDQLGIF